VVQFAQTQLSVIPTPALSAEGIRFLPAAEQQIPRAVMPRCGMTIFKLHHYPKELMLSLSKLSASGGLKETWSTYQSAPSGILEPANHRSPCKERRFMLRQE
jgi:hypothetical protein